MWDKLEALEQRFAELNDLMSRPEILGKAAEYQRYARERAELAKIVDVYQRFKRVTQEKTGVQRLLEDAGDDEEMTQLGHDELAQLQEQEEKLTFELKTLLLPADADDQKSVIVEIRAGTGGEEAALFAADLFRMYTKYSERQGWRVEIMDSHPTGIGGFKEIVASVEGRGVYSLLKYESGTHRVQRVPVTESQGRIHTSAVTVAILPEAEEVEVQINPEELRIDVFRSSGPGGQSVNTTDSAVRVTHLPTGIVVSCQDEKSQHKNRAKALRVLRARLLDVAKQEQQDKISRERRSQIGSGDRSERIRTYNFPQGRVTDHRINITLYKLGVVLEGEIDELIEALRQADQAEKLKDFEKSDVHA
ncbi:MAG TPA: peptide chain release factor 1 [Gammaproteobacteria bacterium]|jgi:peptide chain release factor 1|nr:peptide chain release factor 1 [Gammaproteobacteria bacterium]